MTTSGHDIEGVEVHIGDIVWIIAQGYREFTLAKIIKITPKGFKVREMCRHTYSQEALEMHLRSGFLLRDTDGTIYSGHEYFVTDVIKMRTPEENGLHRRY